MASMRERLVGAWASPEKFNTIKTPDGVDIGAISPEEIALSIFSRSRPSAAKKSDHNIGARP